jgi:hypothetical protein
MYDGVSKSFRIGHLERELQMVQFSATMCSCIAILWVSLVSFADITLCVASQRVFVVVYFVIVSVRKLLDTPLYIFVHVCMQVCKNYIHVIVHALFTLFVFRISVTKNWQESDKQSRCAISWHSWDPCFLATCFQLIAETWLTDNRYEEQFKLD